ncbi:MAG: hypothetical protein HFE48_03930 [Clostridia bacterium]|nr:hypothetical protein [Clostridia bacterium]
MKKKLLYLLLTFAIAVTFGIGSAAMLTTSDALAKTSASAEGEDVSVSQSAENIQGTWTRTTAAANIAGTAIAANCYYKQYNYTGGAQTVVLPAGQYILEAWGAQGGNDANYYGGHGGYTQAKFTVSGDTTVRIVIGGNGASGANNSGGGYNGGGNAGSYGSSGAGGGATHFQLGNASTLSGLKGRKNDVLIVAGGGGGAGNTYTTNGHNSGWGGNSPGPAYGTGGYLNGNDTYFGQGQHRVQGGGSVLDGGGGGGGYYGGRGSNADANGGGGSSFVNTSSGRCTNAIYRNGNANMPNPTSWNGNYTKGSGQNGLRGYARIISLNTAPVAKSGVNGGTAYRGESKATSLTPTSLATDTGNACTTLSWAESNKVYSNSACTTLATSFFDVTNVTAGGTGAITLKPKILFGTGKPNTNKTFYIKVKDNGGLVTTCSFTFESTDRSVTARTGISVVNSGKTNEYRVGTSNTTNVNEVKASNKIYNPAASKYTVVVVNPIAAGMNDIVINASDLFTDADATTYDQLLITKISNPTSTAYTVAGQGSTNGLGFTSVKITHNAGAAMTTYINSVTLTVQSMEKSSKKLVGNAPTINLVFKIDNTRPKITADCLYSSRVGAGATNINLSQFCSDVDGNRLEIKEVKVPVNEFNYVDYKNGVATDRAFGYTGSVYDFPASDNGIVSGVNGTAKTGEGTKALKFERNSAAAASGDTSQAYVSYSIDPNGQYITLNPLRATRSQYDSAQNAKRGDFYIMVRVEDKGDPSDTGIWFPIAIKIANTMPSQPSAVAVADSASAKTDAQGNKVMYFSPMGLGVLEPTEENLNSDAAQIPAIADDRDVYATFVDGASTQNVLCTYMYNEFLVFDQSHFDAGKKIKTPFYEMELVPLYAKAVTAAKIAKGKSILKPSGVTDGGWQRYDEWGSDIWIAQNSNNSLISFYGIKVTFLRSTNNVYIQQPIVVKDTRGETNSATSSVNTGTLDGLVNLLVKVSNSEVTRLDKDEIAKTDENISAARSNTTGYDALNKNGDAKVKAQLDGEVVTYYVPNGYTFDITPYDIAADVDMAAGWKAGENTNPLRKRVNNAIADTNAAYTAQLAEAGKELSYFFTTDLLSLSTTEGKIKLDELTFSGDPFGTNMSAGDISSTAERLTVSTTSRTSTGNPMSFNVRVTDGTSTKQIQIRIHVIDNAPELKEEASGVFYLSSNYAGLNASNTNSSSDYDMDDFVSSDKDLYAYNYNIREIKPVDIAVDYEDSNLYFANSQITFYTLGINGKYQQLLDGDFYVDASFAMASGTRTGQVLKIVAKSSTQNLPGGLFIGVNITDNYGYDSAANTSEIIIQVEVVNALPEVNRDIDNFGFTPNTDEDGNTTYEWKISPSSSTDIETARYVVSSKEVLNHLRGEGVSDKNMRLMSADNDNGQGLYLYAGGYENSTQNVPNVPLYGVYSGDMTETRDIAVYFTRPSESYVEPIKLMDIVYFKDNGVTFTELPKAYDHDGTALQASSKYSGPAARDYIDNPHWAIKITATASFAEAVQFTVRVRDTADRSRAGEGGYNGKRVLNTAGDAFVADHKVLGATELHFSVDIGSLGMTVPHVKYNTVGQTGGTTNQYYTEDGTGAFIEYKDFYYNGIDVGSAVSVPISYFAYPSALPKDTTDSEKNKHIVAVSYNSVFHNGFAANKHGNNLNKEIFKNISLTDGVTVWSGETLNDNPFVMFDSWLMDSVPGTKPMSNYINSNLTAPGGTAEIHKLLYENRHGITITSRGPRSGSAALKLTLDLALYKNFTNNEPTVDIDSASNLPVTAKVTVDVRLENKNIKVVDANSTTDTQIEEYSTGTYIPQSNRDTYTFRLVRKNQTEEGIINVRYTDDNRITIDDNMSENIIESCTAKYLDGANFLFNSLGTTDAPVLTRDQLRHMISADTANSFANTQPTTNLTKNLAKYLGLTQTTDTDIFNELNRLLSAGQESALDTILANVKPNAHYDDYFDIEPSVDGESFTIKTKKKTSIEYTQLTGYDASKSLEENLPVVEAAAHNKNLDVRIENNAYVFYFPLKVIVYDTYNGSGFLDGTWQLLTILVRINNAAPTVNTSLYGNTSSSSTPYFAVSLTKGDEYTLNMTETIFDSDFVRQGNSYMTQAEIEASSEYDIDANDWLVFGNGYKDIAGDSVPDVGYANYKARSTTGGMVKDSIIPEADKVIEAEITNNTIKLKALKKVSGQTFVIIRVRDNHGAYVNFNVLVSVVNKPPELLHKRNSSGEILSGTQYYPAGTTDIKMKTGDSFDVVVTPYDSFYNALSSEQQNNISFGGTHNPETFSMETMAFDKIKPFLSDSTKAEYFGKSINLGSYVVADDDSPESLRFSEYPTTQSVNGKFTVTAQNIYRDPAGNGNVMTVHVVASGVCSNMPLKFTVMDGSRKTVSVTFNVTVVSTPPQMNKDVPDGLEKETDPDAAEVNPSDISDGRVFRLDLKAGEKFNLPLSALCNDPDVGETASMYLYNAFNGSPFSIGGDESGITSSQYVKLSTPAADGARPKSLIIEPNNFIAESGKSFEQIVFYVMDANGQSLADAQKIIINVYIEPNEVTNPSIQGANRTTVPFSVKSKAAYEDETDVNEKPSKLTVIKTSDATRAASGYIVDPDVAMNGTAYSIKVYALLDVTVTDGSLKADGVKITDFETVKDTLVPNTNFNRYEVKRYVTQGGSMVTESASEVNADLYGYVSRYFEMDFSSNGATINFVPTNVTLERNIPICVEVTKRGVPSGTEEKYTSRAYFSISVDNSAPTAMAESEFNDNAFDVGGVKYLHFVGKVGESRTYFMQDGFIENSEEKRGLFTDLDSNDTLKFVETVNGGLGYEVPSRYDFGDGEGEVAVTDAWKANPAKRLGTAFTIEKSSDLSRITVKINRKVDAGELNGKDSYRIPVRVYGEDRSGARISTVIILEITNTAPVVVEQTDASKGYTVTPVAGSNDEYLFAASIEGGKRLTVNLKDIYYDADSVSDGHDIINFVGGSSSDGYLTDISRNPGAVHPVYTGTSNTGDVLFRITSSEISDKIYIEGVSYKRGAQGIARLQIADSTGARTKTIILQLTVGNSAPTRVDESKSRIDLLGSNTSEENSNSLPSQTFSILDFFNDKNPDDMTAVADSANGQFPGGTYLRIVAIELLPLDESGTNGEVLIRPESNDPNDPSGGKFNNLFMTGVSSDNPQKFFVRGIVGTYGWQMLRIFVLDDGGSIDATDVGEPVSIDIRVVFARDPSDQVGNTISIVRGRTEQNVTVQKILDRDGKPYSSGYTITGFEIPNASKNSVEITTLTDDDKKIRHDIRATGEVGKTYPITAKCNIGSLTGQDVTFYVLVTENKAPDLKADYKNDICHFMESQETAEGIIRVAPDYFFVDDDEDLPEKVMKFLSVKSSMPSACDVTLDKSRNEIILKFKANSEVELTIEITDETGDIVSHTVKVQCKSKPNLSFFASMLIFISNNPWLFSIVVGSLLLFIIILIIIIIAVKKKRKMRREIEALLVSEMEMEEQMLKLSAGQQQQNPYYNSYGYLPPTQATPNAPMLGQGGPAAGATPPPTTTAIGLNPGASKNEPPKNDGNGGGFDGSNF